MQEKEFVALVNRLELYERDHPAMYRVRVGLLAGLGYLVLFGALGVALLFVVGVINLGRLNVFIISSLIFVLGTAFVILRSLWIEFPDLEGHELKYDDAPRLFELVKEVRAATAGPSLYKVLLTNEYNASIVQHPRLGMLGWHQNYLQIGLPLLRALSPNDIRAIVAHEFGHLSGSHGKFTSWIYRVRQTWIQVLETAEKHRTEGLGIFVRFSNWYAPYFNAYSFVLARAQEYEADRCAVTVSGKEKTACALINLKLKGKLLTDEFWPAIFARADTDCEPPRECFAEMLQSLCEPIAPEKAQVWFSETLTVRHRYDDTHPALADRLASIGYAEVRNSADLGSFVATEDQPRADQYFIARFPQDFIGRQNDSWKEEVATSWSERHKFVSEAQQALAGFEEKAQAAELTAEESWERARFLAGKDGVVVAAPLMREVLALAPEHVGANYSLGEALLQQCDEAGIKHIEAAMEKDAHAIPAGCETIISFLMTHGRMDEVEKYRDCISGYYDELTWARRERETMTKSDAYESHGLQSEAVEVLREQLATVPLLEVAYLVKKVCKHFPQDTCYVLGVTSKRILGLQLDGRDTKLVNQLATTINYSDYTFIIALEHSYKSLRKIFKRIEGAEIYRAS
ncbi:MAG TPA: M48 family metallopeptidase [Pyrinomonadaceae bacterium]|nr:M48 family metallopeptidase [Pyrinomonadaceae bacterium]